MVYVPHIRNTPLDSNSPWSLLHTQHFRCCWIQSKQSKAHLHLAITQTRYFTLSSPQLSFLTRPAMVECGQTGGCGAGCTLGLGILLFTSLLGIPPNALALGDRRILSTNIGLLFSTSVLVDRLGSSSRRDVDFLLRIIFKW